MNMYSVFDAAAQYFMPPFFARTDGEAKRMFIGSLGDSFQFRADYNLFSLGAFDQDTGTLTAAPAPMIVLSGATIPEEHNPSPMHPLRASETHSQVEGAQEQ